MSRKIYCKNTDCNHQSGVFCTVKELHQYSDESGQFVCGTRTDLKEDDEEGFEYLTDIDWEVIIDYEQKDHVNEKNNTWEFEVEGTAKLLSKEVEFTYAYSTGQQNGGGGHTINNADKFTDEEVDQMVEWLDDNYDYNNYRR